MEPPKILDLRMPRVVLGYMPQGKTIIQLAYCLLLLLPLPREVTTYVQAFVWPDGAGVAYLGLIITVQYYQITTLAII